MDCAEPKAFRRGVLARGRWWRAARILFCSVAGALFWYGATRQLARYSSEATLPNLLWLCGLFAVVLWCGVVVILAVVEPIAWSARARSAFYVVTDRRLLLVLTGRLVRPLVSYVGEHLGDDWSEPPGVNLSLGTTRTSPSVVVRTLDGIIGASPSSGGGQVVLFHHDWRDEDGVWHQKTTTLPGVRDPIRLCEHIARMSSFGRVPCPRGADNAGAPGCECVSSWRAARQPFASNAL